jgi:hypothetical protein
MIAVFVTSEKYLTNQQISFGLLVQGKIADVPVRDDATHPHPVSPKFVIILCLRAFQMTLPSRLLELLLRLECPIWVPLLTDWMGMNSTRSHLF